LKIVVSNKRKLNVGKEEKKRLDSLYEVANKLMKDIALVIEKRKYNSKQKIQAIYYDGWRQKYPELPAQIIINCIDKVLEAFKSAWVNSNSLPQIIELPVRLARDRAYYIDKEGNVKIQVEAGRNNTITGKVSNLTYSVDLAKGAELSRDDGEYNLTISFVKDFSFYNPVYAVGIDFNTDCYGLAVIRGEELIRGKIIPHNFMNVVEYYTNKRKHVLKKKEKLKNRIKSDYEEVMNEVYNFILQYQPCFVFIEELKGINQKIALITGNKLLRSKYHHLPFKKAYEFLRMKLLWNGIFLDQVYPFGTSRRCYICGREGKRKRKEFECEEHGKIHADINAGANIALRGIKKRRRYYYPIPPPTEVGGILGGAS